MLKDFEIAHQKQLVPIERIAQKIDLSRNDLILYGDYKAKIKDIKGKKNGNVILVTAINPTPFGEGKTTVAIGLHDAFWQLGVKSLLTLREPSLGPVFGIKGGATGGGYAQILPMEDINLHFNGDFHAITSANNLISAMIDNSLKQGNMLNLDVNQIFFERTMDMNDRSLRTVDIALGGNTNGIERTEHFTITAASEIMAIFCVSKDMDDLRRRIDSIIIGKNFDNEYVYVNDLGITGSVLALLRDAMQPNLVQTLEENPVLVHGGPFANIAPGVNSIRAIDMAKKLSDVVITEAGFGSDLGGFKFLDIICRNNQIKPHAVVLVATIKALKYNGGVEMKNIAQEDVLAIEKGISNLLVHIENLQTLHVPFLVTLNQYSTDTEKEIEFVKNYVTKLHVPFVVNNVHEFGGKGALSLAKSLIEFQKPSLTLVYENKDSLKDKIEKVCRNIFHAGAIEYSTLALEKLNEYQHYFPEYPICIAKTQYSISDNKDLLGYPHDFNVTVRDLHVSNGAEFIVVYLGEIMTMPGLSKNPAALTIDINDNNEIINLY